MFGRATNIIMILSSLTATQLHFASVNLAKYAGPAACYPPSRAIVDQLFEAADTNHSGSKSILPCESLRLHAYQLKFLPGVYYYPSFLATNNDDNDHQHNNNSH